MHTKTTAKKSASGKKAPAKKTAAASPPLKKGNIKPLKPTS